MPNFHKAVEDIFGDHMFSLEEIRTMEIIFWCAALGAIEEWIDAKTNEEKAALVKDIQKKSKLSLNEYKEMWKEKSGI